MKRVPGPKTFNLQILVTVAVTASITAAAGWYWSGRDDVRRTLAAAAGSLDHRIMQARVTGFPHRPLKKVGRGANQQSSLPLLDARAAVVVAGKRLGDVERAHASGLSRLLFEDWDGAVQALHDALRVETREETIAAAIAASKNATLLSDLAAAHHSRGSLRNRPHDYLLAAEAAARAWSLQQSEETAWNRALTIEALSMRDAASAAWRDYLRIDDDSPWVGEVREHLEALDAPTVADEWSVAQPLLERAALQSDQQTVARLVERFPDHARRAAEREYLPRAASHAHALALCRAIGRALRDTTGESLLYDTIAHLDAADQPRRAALLRAFRIYGDAHGTRDSHYSIDEAGRLFRVAFEALRGAGSPFADSARLYFWNCERYADDRRVIAESEEWLARPPQRYPALIAQVRWILGLSHARVGHPQAAIEEYTQALALFARLGETENVTAMHLMLSEMYEFVGDPEGAWRHRFAALERVGATGTLHPTLLETLRLFAVAALKEGFPSAAVLLLDRQAAETNTPARADMHVATLVWRSHAHRALGNAAAASLDLQQAEAAAGRIKDAAVRAAAFNEVGIVLARLSHTRDAAERQRILDQAIDFATRRKLGLRVASFHLQQGLEQMRLNERAAAERSFYASAEHFERQRATIADEDQRSTFQASRHDVYRYLAALLTERGAFAEAFDVMERSRARTLFEQVTQDDSPALLSLREMQTLLPRDTALVVFGAVSEQFGVWVVSSSALQYVPIAIEPKVLEREVIRFRTALREEDERAALAAARLLHQSLVQPWYAHARDFERLVFIADAPLAAVPFAALNDAATGEFLMQRHILSTTPSANVFVASRPRAEAAMSALIVAPATSIASVGEEALLAASRLESRDVAKQYASPLLLDGPAATREEFLARAPAARSIHFAGHAVSRNAAVPHLLFANSTALYAEDIRDLRLDATRVVVLAACDSGSDRGAGGAQGISSLARAFLAAGVPAVVASYWDVEDDRAARLSRRLHQFLGRGDDPAAALRNAQLQSLTSPDARSRHVSSWAPFVVIHQRTNNEAERGTENGTERKYNHQEAS